jgi:hypothetical protein
MPSFHDLLVWFIPLVVSKVVVVCCRTIFGQWVMQYTSDLPSEDDGSV